MLDKKLNDNLDDNSNCHENETNSDYSKYLAHAFLSLYLRHYIFFKKVVDEYDYAVLY